MRKSEITMTCVTSFFFWTILLAYKIRRMTYIYICAKSSARKWPHPSVFRCANLYHFLFSGLLFRSPNYSITGKTIERPEHHIYRTMRYAPRPGQRMKTGHRHSRKVPGTGRCEDPPRNSRRKGSTGLEQSLSTRLRKEKQNQSHVTAIKCSKNHSINYPAWHPFWKCRWSMTLVGLIRRRCRTTSLKTRNHQFTQLFQRYVLQ